MSVVINLRVHISSRGTLCMWRLYAGPAVVGGGVVLWLLQFPPASTTPPSLVRNLWMEALSRQSKQLGSVSLPPVPYLETSGKYYNLCTEFLHTSRSKLNELYKIQGTVGNDDV